MEGSTNRQRPALNPWDIGFGAAALVTALLALLVWFPNDIKGGFIETVHTGRLEPGDAFFPVLLAGMMLFLGVVQVLRAIMNRALPDPATATGKLTSGNLTFLLSFYAIALAGVTAMYWLGPLTVEALNAAGIIDQSYRQLVDTVPYKYLGYLVGGFCMTLGLIRWAEGKVRPSAVLTVVGVLAAAVLIFDVLLNNVQLPPNADF